MQSTHPIATNMHPREADRDSRSGFTLIELLVVIAIIAILIALLLPAVQQAREAARRSQCKNNLKQIALAIHNYESTYSRLPTSGEGTHWANRQTAFFPVSLFTSILPFVDQAPVYDMFDFNYPYNADPAAYPGVQNSVAAKTVVPTYLCPSNASYQDNGGGGYGQADYMPVAYIDIDPVTGLRNPMTAASNGARKDGFLTWNTSRFRDCTDGTSNTIAVFEDSGRPPQVVGHYPAPAGFSLIDTCGTGMRCPNRWADGDVGSGVSGPPNLGSGDENLINNNKTPLGGPADCPWTTNNCGPNDEPFSFHTGGCHVALGDGSARFLSENIDRHVIRRLCDRSDGEPVGEF